MEINLEKIAFDIDFHPSDNLVAAGLINGDLHLYRYNADSVPVRLLEVHAHTESCRAVRFINGGRALLTGSPDCSIMATDVETGSTIARFDNAHDAAVNRLINLTESTVASGDDEGCIKVWDIRERSCSNTFDVHEDYISDITFASDAMKILATSGDGTLSVCNLRRNKVQAQSEFSEDELLSVVIMKNGRKVVCGSQTGILLLYSWGCFKDCSDRFIDLSPNSIDTMLKLDEDRIITGSENGLINLVGILPNRVIQPIAEHSEYPVERLGNILSSASISLPLFYTCYVFVSFCLEVIFGLNLFLLLFQTHYHVLMHKLAFLYISCFFLLLAASLTYGFPWSCSILS
ncbi:PREDICTED: WD repeat-containing protein 55-like isoform X2 [Lupinus angustifolius]|uniref:WD repeat-containing protein 55-like isoform X2 n=1 Tax=Lupinus angustifolius TaxID=3871 RepID=UPI00092E9FAC|nr:PREDICTED: WD repeat-containing protein 55-like isoform X2 [Lupinus angustifolius]